MIKLRGFDTELASLTKNFCSLLLFWYGKKGGKSSASKLLSMLYEEKLFEELFDL
jgi:hypothetical protein